MGSGLLTTGESTTQNHPAWTSTAFLTARASAAVPAYFDGTAPWRYWTSPRVVLVTHTHSLASEAVEVVRPHTMSPPCGPALTTLADPSSDCATLITAAGSNVPLKPTNRMPLKSL